MKIKSLIAISALLTSGAVLADTYQADVGADIGRIDNDGVGGNQTYYGITGAYYFDMVQTSNIPLAEAAYLGKNSNAHARAARSERPGPDNTFYEVGAEFFIPESFLYVDAGVQQDRGTAYTDNDWYTSVGVTPIDGLLVSTTYAHDEGYDPNIRAKYVTGMGAGEFLNVEAQLVDGDDTTYKMLGADYYFDRTFSVGGMIEDAYSDNTFTIRTRKFFSEMMSGELAYADAPDGNVISVGANIRF